MQNPSPSRRNVIAGLAATLSTIAAAPKLAAAALTPRAAEGPFYPTSGMRTADIDNDLVKVAGGVREAGGDIMILKGFVTEHAGKPLGGLRVEIWQTDMNGKYMHPGDNRSLPHDPAFQGFGHDMTAKDGAYRFRTIKPTLYPGRAPHIHVKVLNGTSELLTTQFYIKDHASNESDFLFRRMSATERDQVEMSFVDGPEGQETTVNMRL